LSVERAADGFAAHVELDVEDFLIEDKQRIDGDVPGRGGDIARWRGKK
jgi:hypothetical protein